MFLIVFRRYFWYNKKMAENSKTQQGKAAAGSKLKIPAETQKNFGELIQMMLQSRSMNDEERQYWVDVLPIMTEEQIANLRDILETEKKEIQAADRTYAKGMAGEEQKVKMAFDEAAYKAKKDALRVAEKDHENKEAKTEESLLQELENLQV